MTSRIQSTRTRTNAVATTLTCAAALIAFGWPNQAQSDPDFPSIPRQSSDLDQDSDQQAASSEGISARPQAGGDDQAPDGPPSARDCTAVKFVIGHVQALVSGQVDVSQRFASKNEGQLAVDKDLEALNQVELYLVYAETGIEDPDQRAKITSYKDALGQVSLVVGERRDQDLTKPAAYDWAGKLSQAQAKASNAFLNVGNGCIA